MKINDVIQTVVSIVLLLALFAVCCLASFFAMPLFYASIGLHPPDVLVQVINSLMGLLLAIVIITLLRFNHMAQYKKAFNSVLQATEKIAKGDFDVAMNLRFQDDEQFDKLVKNVDTMALELNRMEKMRQEFISNVSHEIQSPLTSIRGFAQALRNKQINLEERLHYLSIIETESRRLSKLSDNLLKLASLEAATIPFDPQDYRLDKQLKSLILSCEPQWQNKQIDMEASLEEITIKADEDLMSQVWINLIGNSIKFTPKGGQIRVALQHRGNKVECQITDTGIGIKEDDQIHIFERFYKSDMSRDRSNKGSGLGLSITQKIVAMHNGSIRVQSALEKGATFIVSLPK
ncbi:HAMP domain-containing sensor histidine kinase [Desulfosporosinus sp. PR]|uniref:sensor histidine kinase n=1 Tax=Candidatus Desulfosporosinus nitrosoreducens TaxID=3401928 RepID=UPI0027F0FEAC|nr:HAMP domain-containing sensor histidine kinase [Desulfosporosinus sp. PR]MDQ7096548.1 HAMP domain-containing sensor histidine kinase [Desulfosporosinus sp. PR]